MTPIFFSQPTSSVPWWRRSAIWDPRGPHQTPQTAIHTPKATQFSLSTFNVGKDASSCPKIANETHLFFQPTSSMPGGRRLAIRDPGGPHQTPQTAIYNPKRCDFPYPPSGWVKTHPPAPKLPMTPILFSTHFIQARGRRSTIWDLGGPRQIPQTIIHTPEST